MREIVQRRKKKLDRKGILVFAVLWTICMLGLAYPARAETLSWTAVTTYTDGSSIGSATVTYSAYWSSSNTLSNLHSVGSAGTSTNRAFNIDTESMPRGQTIYFTAKSTVGGVDSALAAPLAWPVPTKAPAAPTNLRMQ